MSGSSNTTCPAFDENYQVTLDSWCFIIAYPFISCLALAGNCTVVWLVSGKSGAIRRATYRCLTLLLCGCELLAAAVLALLLLRLGVGRRNRLLDTSAMDAGWVSELENPLATRRPSFLTVLVSLRDFTIGGEIFAYCLLAIDRLLAVAAPTTRVWNLRLAVGLSAGVLGAMAVTEVGLQTWRWLDLPLLDAGAACARLRAQTSANALTKAGIAISLYAVSAVAYAATGAVLAMRRRSSKAGDAAAGESDEQRQALRLSLIGLALGNLIQLLSLVPMTLENVASLRQDYCLYCVFYANSAAVPCLTVAFNASVRDRLAAAVKRSGRRRVAPN